MSRRAGVHPAETAHEDGPLGPVELEARQLGVMLEGGRTVAGVRRLRHPELDGMDLLGVGRVLLRMGHPVPCRHQVQLPRPDQLLGAQTVQMQQLAGHQPRHRLQAQVRMRPDPERPARFGPDGADMIHEAPGPHAATGPLGQDPSHGQGADLGDASRGDLDDGALGPVRGPGHRRGVVGGDRSAHRSISYTFRVVGGTDQTTGEAHP